jgi:hypothetical protein
MAAQLHGRGFGSRRRDAKGLSLLVKKYRKIYESQYEEIRHRHIANTDLVDGPELWALHAKTNIRDLERLIVFLNKFHRALWEMYYNGERPRLRPMRWSVRSLVRENVENTSSR